MKLAMRDIEAILELFARSPFRELRLETAEVRLALSKGGARPAGEPIEPPAPERAASPALVPASAGGAVRGAAAAPAAGEAGEILVRAPVMGTFYRAPSPDAPPFVTEGAAVAAEDTVGLIEVMKLYSSVPAGAAGTVARILAANGALVRIGEPLVAIRPAGA